MRRCYHQDWALLRSVGGSETSLEGGERGEAREREARQGGHYLPLPPQRSPDGQLCLIHGDLAGRVLRDALCATVAYRLEAVPDAGDVTRRRETEP